MTIQVEISPEVEASLKAEAALHGMQLQEYAAMLLEERRPLYATGTGILRPGDVKAMTKALTMGSEKLPVLSPEANERATYYGDRW